MREKNITYTVEKIRELAQKHHSEFDVLESMSAAEIEINALDDYRENLADDAGYVNFSGKKIHIDELEKTTIQSLIPIDLDIQAEIKRRKMDISIYVNNILRQQILNQPLA